MRRILLATTALTALLAAPALAASSTTTPATTPAPAAATTTSTTDMLASGYSMHSGDNLASKTMGAEVYSSTASDAQDIGKIKDLVLGDNGSINAVVLAIGGFLGVGEKDVAVNFDKLQWSKAADGSWRYVLNTTKDAMAAAPDFKWPGNTMGSNDQNTSMTATPTTKMDNTAAANTAATAPATTATTTTAMTNNGKVTTTDKTNAATATNNAANTNMANNTTTTIPDRSTMQPMDMTHMKADDLKGDVVMGENNQQIGKISDFVLTKDGKVDAVIVDVGGFLGIGAKPVAIAFNAANFSTDKNGHTYMYINATKKQLNAQTTYDKNTYNTNRDAQLLKLS